MHLLPEPEITKSPVNAIDLKTSVTLEEYVAIYSWQFATRELKILFVISIVSCGSDGSVEFALTSFARDTRSSRTLE